MGIEDIIESINKELDRAITYENESTLDQYLIHHKLLSLVSTIENLIEEGTLDKRYQTILNHVKEIAYTIKPTTNLDCYG